MKTSPVTLTKLLHNWQVTPSPDPNFRHNVWERIRRSKRVTWLGYLKSHATIWFISATMAMVVAGYTGNSLARSHVRTDRENLVVTYLVNLDPRVQAALNP